MGNTQLPFPYVCEMDKTWNERDALQRVFNALVDIRDGKERKMYKCIEAISFRQLTPVRSIILAYLQPGISEEELFLYVYMHIPCTIQEARTYVHAQSFPMGFDTFAALPRDMEMLRYFLWLFPDMLGYFKDRKKGITDPEVASAYRLKTCELLCNKLHLLMGKLVYNGICTHTFVFSPHSPDLKDYQAFIEDGINRAYFALYCRDYREYGRENEIMRFGREGEYYTIRLTW